MLFLLPMGCFSLRLFSVLFLLAILSGCANIVPPTGGKKDSTPPKLMSVMPPDSQLNKRVTKIELRFDEFITLNEPAREIQISPVMQFPLNSVLNGKKVTVSIPDSLLRDSTTYRISFGTAIKDLHEGNAFPKFSYTFSTGPYFDSLNIVGMVYDATTGKPAPNIDVLLYDRRATNDSAIVQQKPEYVARSGGSGMFLFQGLPCKPYRVYALKDDNANLVYDGDNEMVAFIDSTVFPVDSPKLTELVNLQLFKEDIPPDTLSKADSTKLAIKNKALRLRAGKEEAKELLYSVSVDTSSIEKRTFDVNKQVRIAFNRPLDTFDASRVFLSFDSLETEVESPFTLIRDTLPSVLLLNAGWEENTVYTLRLLKDFATDTTKITAMPSKYRFRTFGEEDYGVLRINITSKYYGPEFILQVVREKDTVHFKPILDTTVTLKRLAPGKYNFFIIADANRDGRWTTGNLFSKRQPEKVVPYNETIELKAGWENVIDFTMPVTEDPAAKLKSKNKGRGDTPPGKGDKTPRK